MKSIEEIALRVAKDLNLRSDSACGCPKCRERDDPPRIKAFARALLAELSKDVEPVHWRALLNPGQVHGEFIPTPKVAGFSRLKDAEQFCAEKKDFQGWDYSIEPLFTHPAPANTAEIEQRVAEAIAKWLESLRQSLGDKYERWLANEIRSGKWREYL